MPLSADAIIAIVTLLVAAAPIVFALAKYVQRRRFHSSPYRSNRLLPLAQNDVPFDRLYLTSIREARYLQREDVFCKGHVSYLHG